MNIRTDKSYLETRRILKNIQKSMHPDTKIKWNGIDSTLLDKILFDFGFNTIRIGSGVDNNGKHHKWITFESINGDEVTAASYFDYEDPNEIVKELIETNALKETNDVLPKFEESAEPKIATDNIEEVADAIEDYDSDEHFYIIKYLEMDYDNPVRVNYIALATDHPRYPEHFLIIGSNALVENQYVYECCEIESTQVPILKKIISLCGIYIPSNTDKEEEEDVELMLDEIIRVEKKNNPDIKTKISDSINHISNDDAKLYEEAYEEYKSMMDKSINKTNYIDKDEAISKENYIDNDKKDGEDE